MLGPYFATSVSNRFAAWCGFEDEAREILAAWQAKDRARNLAAVTDDMIDRIAIIGTADECRRKLRAFHEAGVTTPMVHPFLFDERAISRRPRRRIVAQGVRARLSTAHCGHHDEHGGRSGTIISRGTVGLAPVGRHGDRHRRRVRADVAQHFIMADG
jgi:hypothetical protein